MNSKMKRPLFRVLMLSLGLLCLAGLCQVVVQADRPQAALTRLFLPTLQQRRELDPLTLTPVGHLGGSASFLTVQGQYAYAAFGSELVVLDISDPTAPRPVGQTGWLGEWINDIVVIDHYLYLASGAMGIRIVDIANPRAPQVVRTYSSPGTTKAITVVGQRAYVAANEAGLRILDIADPTQPKEIGFFPMDDFSDVAVVGSYAYVADNYTGLWVLDVSDPKRPVRVRQNEYQWDTVGISIVGQYLYLVDNDYGLGIYDISDPTRPRNVGNIRAGSASDVTVVGRYAYVSAREFHIIDVSDPTQPTRAAMLRMPAYTTLVVGDHAFVAAGTYGMQVMDVSRPVTLAPIGSYTPSGDAYLVRIKDSIAYVADNWTGLHLVDLHRPERPVEVSHYPQWKPTDIFIADQFAYLTNSTGFHILNVAQPSQVHEVGFYDTGGYADGVFVKDHLAYVVDHSQLRILDVSDPTSPRLLGSQPSADPALQYFDKVIVAGNYAYISGRGFRVVDVSSPAAPRLVGSYGAEPLPWGGGQFSADEIDIQDHLVYAANGTGGVGILDVSNPSSPVLIGKAAGIGDTRAVKVIGRYAYAASLGDGLVVIDVVNPAAPREVARYTVDWFEMTRDVDVADGYVYVAGSYGGLLVFRALEQ